MYHPKERLQYFIGAFLCQELFSYFDRIIFLTKRESHFIMRAMRLNIRKLESERERVGLRKTEFSKYLGLSATTYDKMLISESTTLKTLTKIASALYLDPKDLLTN
jgi:DNA-binding Xre family transcriptional regulator